MPFVPLLDPFVVGREFLIPEIVRAEILSLVTLWVVSGRRGASIVTGVDVPDDSGVIAIGGHGRSLRRCFMVRE